MAFAKGKNAKELGIDITKKFKVVGHCVFFSKGDILVIKEDDDSYQPFFYELGKEDYRPAHWEDLDYADEPKPEKSVKFKVGDKIRILEDNLAATNFKRGDITKIIEVNEDGSIITTEKHHYSFCEGHFCSLELIDEEYKEYCQFFAPSMVDGVTYYSNRVNKITATGKKFMNSVVEFAKNISLSKDEKALRKAGLKDNEGNWTSEARTIVAELEAEELGYNSFEALMNKFGKGAGLSVLETANLFAKYDVKLLDIANAKITEDKEECSK